LVGKVGWGAASIVQKYPRKCRRRVKHRIRRRREIMVEKKKLRRGFQRMKKRVSRPSGERRKDSLLG